MSNFSPHYIERTPRSKYAGVVRSLGDTPETVIPTHALRSGRCTVYTAGSPASFHCAVIQLDDLPKEPFGFGTDVVTLWNLLGRLEGWTCINVGQHTAQALSAHIERITESAPTIKEDVYLMLTRPAPDLPHEAVRRLVADDEPLIKDARPLLQGAVFADSHEMLTKGIAAGAVVAGQLVSMAHVTATSARYADIGVATLPEHRERGYGSAAAALVARLVQAEDLTPVWSCSADNATSLQIAHKLGFTEVSRRAYVILDGE